MPYVIREIFPTLQGEGMRAGHRSVFIRFAGCNLWSGDPTKREKGRGACANWCDTDFRYEQSQKMTTGDIIQTLDKLWPNKEDDRWVVLTGGEPMLQLATDASFLEACAEQSIWVAIETNGSVALGDLGEMIDHLCVSPKLTREGRPVELKVHAGDELKVVLPGCDVGIGWTEAMLETLFEVTDFGAYYLQPMDPIDYRTLDISWLRQNRPSAKKLYEQYLSEVLAHIEKHPHWALSLQTHKLINLP